MVHRPQERSLNILLFHERGGIPFVGLPHDWLDHQWQVREQQQAKRNRQRLETFNIKQRLFK